jgi:hypothetical protein
MTLQNLLEQLHQNHADLIQYVENLSDEDFLYHLPEKWTAGQQLDHILTSVKIVAKSLQSKDFLIEKFGAINRPTWDYDTVVENYKATLAQGGKAPDRFVPPSIGLEKRESVGKEIFEYEKMLLQNLAQFTETDLNTCVLPHPLLGDLTIYEMLCMITYHVKHHHQNIMESLKK